jgi:hypothetical protein
MEKKFSSREITSKFPSIEAEPISKGGGTEIRNIGVQYINGIDGSTIFQCGILET